MSAPKFMIDTLPWDNRYRLHDASSVLTPALILYPEIVAANIQHTLDLLHGNADRWRVHVKTAKLNFTLRMFIERGIRNFKCATSLELLRACENNATDVVVAYPVAGANAQRVRQIARWFPNVRISVLVEAEQQVAQWKGSGIGVFVDINPGMNRTGIELDRTDDLVRLLRSIAEAGLEFRGLHYYDGQFGSIAEPERTAKTHAGYDQLLQLVTQLEAQGHRVPELITAGTPTFPCSLSYAKFRDNKFIHRISPGTIAYCDATSQAQLPAEYGYAPAALVLTRVVSHPRKGIITCDAGHKAVSADAGLPTCVVVGHTELTPLSPSEEHLPMSVREGSEPPRIGDTLYLVPRHVCPTVNNFDAALIVRNGKVESVEEVSARGHEGPLLTDVSSSL